MTNRRSSSFSMWTGFLAATACLLALAAPAAHATTYTWTGPANATWTTVTNWDVGTFYPGHTSSDIAILANTGIGTITGSAGQTYDTLEFANTTGSWSISLGTNLHLNTVMQLNNVSNTITGSGTLSGNTSGNLAFVINAGTLTVSIKNLQTFSTLDKSGAGTLFINTTTTPAYTGATNITGGILKQGAANRTASTAMNITGATFDLGGFADSIGALTIGGGSVINSGTAAILTLGGNVASTGASYINAGANIALGASRVFTVSSNTLTVNSSISGTGYSLTKAGAGTLTLTNANTYDGGTTLSAGILNLANASGSALGTGGLTLNGGTLTNVGTTGSLSGNVSAGGGSHLISPGGHGAIGTLYTGSLYLNSNTTLDFSDFNSLLSPTSWDEIVTTAGSLNFTGTTPVQVVVPTGLALGRYTLIDFSAAGGNALSGNFAISGGTPAGYSLAVDSLNYDLVLTVAAANYWVGAAGANWNTTGSWFSGAIPNGTGATALFKGDGGAGVNLDAAVTLGTLKFDSGAISYTLSSGSGSALTFDNTGQSGSATITLTGTSAGQTISAAVIIANTDLAVSNASSAGLTMSGGLSGPGRNLTLAGGLLTLSGGSTFSVGSLTLNAGTLAGAGGAALNVDTGANLQTGTVSVNLAGTMNLTKSAAGTVVLSGSNGYSGTTAISAGTLQLGNASALPTTTALTISGGSTLDMQAFSNSIAYLTLSNGTLASGGAGGAVLSVATNADLQTGTAAAGLAGSMNLTKSTAGTVILSGSNGYSGTTTVSAGVLQLGNANALPSTTAFTLSNGTVNLGTYANTVGTLTMTGGTLTGSAGGALNIGTSAYVQGGLIQAPLGGGSATLTKSGAGTVILSSGASTYGGGTAINGGTLTISNASGTAPLGSGAVTINGGELNGTGNASGAGTLTLNGGSLGGTVTVGTVTAGSGTHTITPGDTAVGTLHTGTLNLNSYTILDFSQITSPTSMDQILSTGSLNVSSPSDSVQVIVPSGLAKGSYKLIDFTTAGSATADNFAFSPSQPSYQFFLDTTNYDLDIVVPPSTYWIGASGTTWNNGPSWQSGSVPNGAGAEADFFSPHGGANVLVDSAITVGTIWFDGSQHYNITDGGGTLTMSNTGGNDAVIQMTAAAVSATISPQMILSSNLSVTSNANGLTISGAIAGSGHNLTLASGLLSLSNTGNTLSTLIVQAGTLGGAGTITLSTNANLQSGTVSLALAGPASVSKTTGGTVVLAGANTYNGDTNVTAGTLQMGAVNAASPNSRVIMTGGATLDLNSNNQLIAGLSGTGGTVTSVGPATLTIYQTTSGGYGGLLTGAVGVTKSGSGILLLNAANTYTGATTISNGTLKLGIAQAIPAASAVTIGSGTTLDRNGLALNLTNSLTLNGGSIIGSGTLTFSGGTLNSTGGTITGGILNIAGLANPTFATSGTLVIGDQITGNPNGNGVNPDGVYFGGPGTIILTNPANNSSSRLCVAYGTTLKNGASNVISDSISYIRISGTWDLNGFSETTGSFGTGLTNAGTVNLNGGTLNVTGGGANDVNIADTHGGGELIVSGSNPNFPGAMTFTGETLITTTNAGGVTFSNGTSANASSLFAVGTGALATISGPNTVGVFSVGGGTISLGGANTGATNVNIGSGVFIQSTANLLPGTVQVSMSGGTYNFSTGQTVAGLSGSSGTVTGTGTLTLNQTSGSQTFGGQLTGTMALAKNGAGALTLSGTSNNFSLGTTLTNGQLILANASGSALGTGGLTLNGGTLASVGSTGGLTGAITAGSGAHTISPGGTSQGVLHTGSLFLNGNTTLDFSQITSPSALDQIISTGTINFSGAGAATILLPAGLSTGIYTLIDYTTASPLTDTSKFTISGSPLGYSLLLDTANSNLDLLSNSNYWIGASGDSWNVTGSWNSGTVPNGAGAIAAFSGSGGSIAMIDDTITIGMLLFNTATSHDIQPGTGTPNLVFDNSGNGNALISLSGAAQTISAPVTLLNTDLQVASNANGLTISGLLTGTGRRLTLAGGLLNLTNAGDTVDTLTLQAGTLGGTLNVTTSANLQSGTVSAILGGGSVTKTTSGLAILSGLNTYSGATTISNGTLRAADGVGLPSGSNLVLDGGVWETSGSISRSLSAGTMRWTSNGGGLSAFGGTLTINLDGGAALTWGGTTNFVQNGSSLIFNSSVSDNTVELQNSIDLNTAVQTVVVNDNPGSTADYAILSGAITNGTLAKAGAGLLVLPNAGNSLTQLQILNGTVRTPLTSVNATNLLLGGGVLESNGAYTATLGTGPGQVQWTTSGGFAAQGGALSLNLGGGTLAWGAASAPSINSWLVLGSPTADSQVSIGSVLSLSSGSGGIYVIDNPSSSGDSAQITGQITSSNTASQLRVSGAGVLILANNNTNSAAVNNYSGATTITSATLRLGANEQIPNSSAVTVNGGLFDRNGYTESIGALTLIGGSVGGGGLLTLGGTLTAFGSTNLSGGTLTLGAGQRAINLSGGSTLTIGDLVSNGTFNVSGNGTLLFTNSGNVFFQPGSWSIIGAGTTVRAGTDQVLGNSGYDIYGTLDLAGHLESVNNLGQGNNGLGIVNLNGGTLVLTGGAGYGTTAQIIGAGTVIASNTTNSQGLYYPGGYTFDHFILAGGNVFTNTAGNSTLTSADIQLQAGTLGLNIIGGAGVTKTTAGLVQLTGSNSYSGTTLVSAGALEFTGSAAYSPLTNVNLAGGVLQIYSTAATVLTPTLGTGAGQIQLTGSGGGFSARGSYLTVSPNANAQLVFGVTPGFLLSGQMLGFGSATASNVTELTNALDLAGAIQTVTVAVGTGGDYAVLSGVLSDGGLAKSGTGTLYVTNSANSFTGGLTVANGILRLNSDGSSLPSANDVTVSGGILDLQSANIQVPSLTVTGGQVAGTGSVTTNTIALQGGVVSVALMGTGGISKTTSGLAVLSGSNTYTGTTNVTAGILNIQNALALGNTANTTTVTAGATLAIQGGYTFVGGGLTLNGAGAPGTGGALESVSGLNVLTDAINLNSATTVNVVSGSLTLSGLISGGASLTTIGNGLLVISNSANNYGGGTTIQAGTLAAVGLLGTGNVTINGGVLQILPGFALSGASHATLNPGGTLEMFTNLAAGVQLGGGTIASHGDRTLSGNLTDAGSVTFSTNNETLTLTHDFTLASDTHTWTVAAGSNVTMSGNFPGSHVFTKLGDGTLLLQGTSNFSTLYAGFGSQSGGYLVANSTPASSVVIAQKSLYTVQQTNYAYNEVNFGASSGVLALSRDSNHDLDFTAAEGGLFLGVYDTAGGVVNYNGQLTANPDNGYLLGGGKGILNIASPLIDAVGEEGSIPTNVQIGWQAGTSNDPLPPAVVRLSSGANTVSGVMSVYGNLQLGNAAALDSVSAINIYTGGTFDMNNTGYDILTAVGLGRLVMQYDGVGGSLANTGGFLTPDVMAAVFPASLTSTYRVGGGGTGTTTIVDGALSDQTGGMGLEKNGTDTAVLEAVAGTSANTYTGATVVNNGTLQIPTVASVATSSGFQINNTGILDFTGSGSLTQTITFAQAGTVRVEAGNLISVASLNLDGVGTSGVLAGGGTLLVTGSAGVVSAGGVLNITDTSTLSIPWTFSATDPGSRFVVANTGTLLFSSNASGTAGIGDSIGTMMPGGTVQFANGLGTLSLSRTAGGLVMDVPASQYPDLGTGAFSSTSNPYTINLGNNTLQIGTMSQVGTTGVYIPVTGSPALQTGQFVQGSVLHTPVAYIAITGSGTLSMQQAMLSTTATSASASGYPAMNVYWLVQGGTLTSTSAGGETSLGTTAPAWFTNGQPAIIAQQHLEGIEVYNGATLAWAGTQASLPASVYGGLAAGNGDGFNPNEFILDKGATLNSSYAPLILGYQNTPAVGPVQNYGLPITVKSDASATPVNLGGTITAHSGIQMSAGGNVNLNVAAGSNITFANDIAGVGYAPVNSLTLNSTGLGNAANVTVKSSFANTQTTTVGNSSTLTLNPGTAGSIAYAGNVVNNGTVHVTSGQVTSMGVISSTTPGIAYTTSGLVAFAKSFDDSVQLTIDGSTLISSHDAYQTPIVVATMLTSGLHTFEVRFGQNGGGVGPIDFGGLNFQTAGISLGYNLTGSTTLNTANFANIPASMFLNLVAGTVAGDIGTGSPTTTASVADLSAMNTYYPGAATPNAVWPDKTTWVYSGQIDIPNFVSGQSGLVTVDVGAELQAAGFTNQYQVDVPGTLTLTGTGLNTTANMTVNGGTLHAAATSTVASTSGIGLGAATVNVDNTKSLTLTGSLSNLGTGTGSLTKTGAGSLILTGNSTYTGPTTVQQGLLKVNAGASLVSAVTVNAGGQIGGTGTIGGLTLSGGTLRPGGASSIGTLSVNGDASLLGGSTYQWKLSSVSGANQDGLSITGNLALGASSGSPITVDITSLGLSDFSNTAVYNWVIASAGSVSGFDPSAYVLNTVNFGFTPTGTFSISQSGSELVLTYTGVTTEWVWTGGTSTWGTGSNWAANSVPGSANRAVFDTAAANQPALLASDSALAVDFRTAGWVISNSGGAGTVLVIGSGGLTSTSTAAGTNTIAVNVALGASQAWTANSGNVVAVTGVLALGGNTLTMNGTGTVQLGGSGAGSDSGILNVNAGLVQLTASNVLGTGVDVNINGATLDILGNANTVDAVSLNGGTILGSGGVLSANAFNVQSGLVTAVLAGGSLNKTTGGTVILSGANTYTGATYIQAGLLQAGAANVISTASAVTVSGAFDLNGFNQSVGSVAGAGSITLGAGTLTTGSDGTTTAYSGTITGPGGVVKTGVGTWTLSNAGNNYGGGTTILGGLLQLGASNALPTGGNVTISGGELDLQANNNTVGAVSLTAGTIAGSGTLTGSAFAVQSGVVTAILAGSGATLTKSTSGVAVLSGVNTFTGATDIQAGSLQAGAANILTSSSAVTVETSGQFNLNNFSQTVRSIGGAGSVYLGGGTLTEGSSNASTTSSGAISGTTGGLVKVGAGTWTLSNASNAFSGPVAIDGGIVSVASAGALGDGTSTNNLLLAGGELLATGNVSSGRAVSVTGAGNVVDVTAGNTVTFSGAFGINSGATLTKTDLGTLTISGTQNNGSGSALVLSGGTTNLSAVGTSNTQRYLSVTDTSATLVVGKTQYLASLVLTSSAKASLSSSGTSTASNTIKTDALSIDGTSLLDVKDGNLVINRASMSLTQVEAKIKAGEGTNSGGVFQWDGTNGITSSAAKVGGGYTALGVWDLGIPLTGRTNPTSLEGVPTDATSILVKYTWIGDMNLDGKVTVDDYAMFLYDFINQGGLTMEWATGDFNGDGKIDVNDYAMFLAGYTAQSGTLSAGQQITSSEIAQGYDLLTPEPATLVLLTLGGLAALANRRRNRKA